MTENVNEKQLLEVLELDDRKLSSPTLEARPFAWSGKLESNPLDSIHITGVGEIKVPIISQDFDRVKAVCHPSPTCSLGLNMTSEATLLPVSAWELPGSFIHFGFVNIAGDLALTAMRQLLGFELQTGFVESRLDKLLLLQPDGHYHRFHETEKAPGIFGVMLLFIPFDSGGKGYQQPKTHLIIKKTGQCHEVELTHRFFHLSAFYADCHHQLLGGPAAILVFQLLWPGCFAASLHPLRLPHFLSALKQIKEEILASWEDYEPGLEVEATSHGNNDSSDDEDSLCIDTAPPEVNPSGNCRIMFIPLEEVYPQLSFHRLRNRDRCKAYLLQALDFMDIRLAIVQAGKVIRWIDCVDSLPQGGSVEAVLPDDGQFLVLQPLSQAIRTACLHGQFDFMLDSMEFRLAKPDSKLMETLHRLLQLCRAEPKRVFGSSDSGERAARLLDFCRNLRALPEGLALLDVLASSSEGLRGDVVARAVADFECFVSGWESCSTTVMRFITPSLLMTQLTSLASLTVYLAERGCFIGAFQVANRLWALLSVLDDNRLHRLNQAQVDAYFDLVIALERDPRTANSRRITTLANLIGRLKPHRQCQLVLDLKADDFARLKASLPGLEVYALLCKALPSADLHAKPTGPMEDLIVPVFKWFLQLNNDELVMSLTETICRPSEVGEANALLDVLLSSPEIEDLISFSPLGRISVVRMLLAHLRAIGRNYPVQRLSSSTYILVLCLVDVQLDATVGELLLHLPAVELCTLILETFQLNLDRGRLLGLFRLLNLKSRDSMAEVPKDVLIRLVSSCVQLAEEWEESCLRNVVRQLKLDGWESVELEKLVDCFAQNDHCWDIIVPASSVWTSETACILLEAWAAKMSRKSAEASREDLLRCVRLYIHNWMEHPLPDDSRISASFGPVFDRLPAQLLVQLASDIYRSDWAEKAHCHCLFRCLCTAVTRKNLCGLVDFLPEIGELLYWSGDGKVVLGFARRVCRDLPACLVVRIVSSDVIREMALASDPDGKTAFAILLDRHIIALKSARFSNRSGPKGKRLPLAQLVRLNEEVAQARLLKNQLMPPVLRAETSVEAKENNVAKKFISPSATRLTVNVQFAAT